MLVCAGVVLRSGAVLLCRRAPGRRHAGLWEFPGGRVEPGESPAEALRRELEEELGLAVEVGAELCRHAHAYDYGTIELVAYLVPRFSGTPALSVHDELAWVPAKDLLTYPLLPADAPIAQAVASHRRRGRYTGTHPKSFAHKYKEHALDPEALEKAKARGSTPAGTHVPVMLEEVCKALEPLNGKVVLDCTLGWGGHAQELLKRGARVIGLDRDAGELSRTAARLGVEAYHSDFAGALGVLRRLGLSGVDGVLADLGVSSMQLDTPSRGFSFKADGPLDMRMDPSRGLTASEWLRRTDETRIAAALSQFGEEPDAERIAAALKRSLPKTTRALAEAVAAAKGLSASSLRKKDASSFHPAARTFQALRMAVNGEPGSLAGLLRDLPWLLKPGGRAALITFHAGEEGLVRGVLGEQGRAGVWEGPLIKEGMKVSGEEARRNPRARTARLWRVARAGPRPR